MSISVPAFQVTVPAGTPQAAPQITRLAVGVFQVDFVEFDIPAGPKGQMGFYLSSNGTPVIPRTAGAPVYLALDDVFKHYDLEDQPTSGAWELVAYNVGNFAHTVTVTFGLSLVVPPAAPAPVLVPLPAEALGSPA